MLRTRCRLPRRGRGAASAPATELATPTAMSLAPLGKGQASWICPRSLCPHLGMGTLLAAAPALSREPHSHRAGTGHLCATPGLARVPNDGAGEGQGTGCCSFSSLVAVAKDLEGQWGQNGGSHSWKWGPLAPG